MTTFVTGTDTGVGKTVFTAMLLHHLRNRGVHALAMKPFCSGGRGDVNLLRALQDRELSVEEINPFYFEEPLSPLAGVRLHRRRVSEGEVVAAIELVAAKCQCLLVEGVGGLMVPLGAYFDLRDLIRRREGRVVVVSRDRLGTLNHTLLTVEALRMGRRPARGRGNTDACSVVLMGQRRRDVSARSNAVILRELLAPMPVLSVPYLGLRASSVEAVKNNCEKIQKTLARVF